MQEMLAQSLGQEDPLEEEMSTHFSIFIWEVSQTEEPGRLQSMASQSWTQLSTPGRIHIYTYVCISKPRDVKWIVQYHKKLIKEP